MKGQQGALPPSLLPGRPPGFETPERRESRTRVCKVGGPPGEGAARPLRAEMGDGGSGPSRPGVAGPRVGCAHGICAGSAGGGGAGEPPAALGLIENRNMLKFSFVLGWGLGNMPFSACAFTAVLPLRLPPWFGSLSACVIENLVLMCVFLLGNCFQLSLYWAWGSVVLRSSSKIKSDLGTDFVLW